MAIFYEDRVNDLKLWKRDTIEFLPHFHDSFEIIFMFGGKARAIIDGKEYQLCGGDLCISLPNVIHAYDNEENVDAYLFIVPRRYAKSFSLLLDKNIVERPVIKLNNSILQSAENIIKTAKQRSPYREQLLGGYFSILFAEIFTGTKLTECHKSPAETERRIIAFCLENFRHDISLELLADELNISKNHISYIFSSKLKICLPDFIGSLRVAEAKRLIESGTSMTDAALESGFASIRTFNRRFLTETGMTPREYAKKHNN